MTHGPSPQLGQPTSATFRVESVRTRKPILALNRRDPWGPAEAARRDCSVASAALTQIKSLRFEEDRSIAGSIVADLVELGPIPDEYLPRGLRRERQPEDIGAV